ncbi:MAG TPA: BON domain-containing protein [Gammaproteobacteria bacterium]|jgi:osmotically-inducible protein OsmY
MRLRKACGIAVTLLLLNGCAAPLILGGAAATGIAVAKDRRTAGTMLDDERIELNVLNEVAREEELSRGSHLNVTSYNGIVLLSGEVETEAMGRRIAELAGKVAKVREVKNALRIGPPSSAGERSRDTVITTRVKSRLVSDKAVDGTSIKVISEHGTVYLMGLVSRDEAASAVEVTRNTNGVQRIVKVFEYTP